MKGFSGVAGWMDGNWVGQLTSPRRLPAEARPMMAARARKESMRIFMVLVFVDAVCAWGVFVVREKG